MAHLMQRLLQTQECLSLIARTNLTNTNESKKVKKAERKKKREKAYSIAQGQRLVNPWGLAASQPNMFSKFQVSEKSCLKNNKQDALTKSNLRNEKVYLCSFTIPGYSPLFWESRGRNFELTFRERESMCKRLVLTQLSFSVQVRPKTQGIVPPPSGQAFPHRLRQAIQTIHTDVPMGQPDLDSS